MRHLRILDTNRLIAHWQRSRKGPLSSYSREDASRWAEALIKLDSTAAVLTPVVLEFPCGARDAHELDLYRAFLARFDVVDRGLISQQDWQRAEQFAAWVPRDSKPRDFADCLIAAIARRMGYEVFTSDLDLSRWHRDR